MEQELKTKQQLYENYLSKGIYYKNKELYDQALNYTKQAYKLKPNNHNARILLAEIFFDSGQYSKAEYWYGQALKMRPDNKCNILMIIYSQYLQSKYVEALMNIDDFVRIRTPNCFSFYLKGLINKSIGNLEIAKEAFQMAISINSSDTDSKEELDMLNHNFQIS